MEEMNELALQQEDVGLQILKLLRNMKKDPESRKTEKYADIRQKTLEALWEEVQANHARMLQYDIPEHNYFTKNYFEQIRKRYQEAKTYLQEIPKSLEEHVDVEVDPEQLLRLKKQDIRLQQLQYIVGQIHQELSQNKTKIRYETLLKKINKQWDGIQDLNEEIMVNDTNSQGTYFTENEYINAEQIYEDTVDALENRIINTPVISETSKPHITLPKIQIPFFDGEYENWPSFYDLFQKVLHENSSLSDIEKMQYLKTHIRGEPSKLIQHLQISEANYETAWNLLQKRYQNSRLLLSKLIDKILDLPSIQYESSDKIKQLHDVTSECLEAINNLGIPTSSWGPLVSRIIARKWDADTNKLYEQSITDPHEMQDFETMMGFLQRRFQSLEAIAEAKQKTNSKNQSANTSTWQSSNNSPSTDSSRCTVECKYCRQNHNIYSCPKFKLLATPERNLFVKSKRLCFNCLNHEFNERCKSISRCRICRSPHHTLLHDEQRKPFKQTRAAAHATTASEKEPVVIANHAGKQEETVLLATALVQVRSSDGALHYLRALIDPGSQASFITEDAAQILSKPREKIRAEITGLGNGEPKVCKYKIHIELLPRFPSHFKLHLDVLILSKLTQTLPSINFDKQNTDNLQNHMIADPTFNKPGPVDVILGAEVYGKIISEGMFKSKNGLLGQNTELGWILSGKIKKEKTDNVTIVSMVTCTEDQQLTKFWELEEVSSERQLSVDDQACEENFSNTFERDEKGSYTVRIPFKERPTDLGNSKSKAAARLLQLEKRFAKNKELELQYKQFMQEYLTLGHMKQVSPKDGEGKYYIPHQAVIRESSSTTKLRVVFDASCKTSFGISLNQLMYVGPRIQQELADILLRWRKHQVAFTADIEKMYRQINIHEDDQPFQRILWRFNPWEDMREYKLTTVTYGTSSAPYLAVKTLQQLAKDEENQFPKAPEITLKDFYVDDLLSGADSLEEAAELVHELSTMLQFGGFTLRKWLSNNVKLLRTIPDNLRDQTTLEIDPNGTKKSLGVLWAPYEDKFTFQVQLATNKQITKRAILSEVAKLFDPLGWLAPVVIKAKLLIQELWLQELEWDKKVPEDIRIRWLSFEDQLKTVEKITVPRWIHYTHEHQVELHGFCDASEKAYGAVIYSKTTNTLGQSQITVLIAKSKVAPARKTTTLPKLELCAALLLAKLMKKTSTALEFQHHLTYAWTDSMITLGWIKGDPGKWKTFVANRVAQIQELLPAGLWNHVKTEDNPADCITRGISPSNLKDFKLWWKGPGWLPHKNQWPQELNITPASEELKLCLQVTTEYYENDILNRFSNLSRMLRVLAYCKRFINGCRKNITQYKYLTVQEMDTVLIHVVRCAQNMDFKNEIKTMQKSQQIEKSSKICNLNPFLDKNGILRVGGRLQNSSLSYTQKHPMVLSNNNHLTNLIISDAHQKTLHGGVQATLAYTRKKFWIINGKRSISSTVNKCTRCRRFLAQVAQQQMGQLPESRVTPSPPFDHTGIDYAGPIQIRTSKGRGHKSHKGYIAVFVCLATKSIHLEVVSDLTTNTFLAAFRRFTARRGTCSHIYSDNGTTFVGAKRIIEKEIQSIIHDTSIHEKLASHGTQWHFIPPAAPHFGGLWEAGVKSMKYHLKRIIGDSTLTYEELSTLVYQIEACLNSRPLCPLTNDANCMQALTPGHFLVGKELVTPPDPITTDINTSSSTRWKLVQKIKTDFWKVWTNDYLNTLQQRYKWNKQAKNLKVGDIVIIKEDSINPSKWPLARISQVYPGKDGLVRVVDVKKEAGITLKRPIHKIIPLHEDPQLPKNETNNINISTNISSVLMKPGIRKKSTCLLLIPLLIVCLFNPTIAHYTVHYLNPGLYIEHIGHAKIERGTFRIEIKFDIDKIKDDCDSISRIVKQMDNLCQQTQKLAQDIQCTSLVHHLREQQNEIEWVTKGIDQVSKYHQKRGLLGDFLTSIFGVNDEVYKDIETLDKNQHDLIKASNHQTKIMLSTLSTFNETEERINKQLLHFNKKLNDGIQAINEMQKWYKVVDDNKLSIHILSSYQIASNCISEIVAYYNKLLNIQHHHGSMYDFLSPAQVGTMVTSASNKLPTNINILPTPILRTKVEHHLKNILVYGYFLMTEMAEFVLIKATPIPLRIENDSYWVLDLTKEIIAINYNTQLYFQLNEYELKNSIALDVNQYICSPTTVRSIENSPNCVIDEIYQRSEHTSCDIMVNKIHSIIWKQLYTVNSWMFITNKKIKVALTCNGIREDVQLNMTGIIQTSPDCIISTRQNILTPRRNDHVTVLAGFTKNVSVNIQPNITYKHYEDLPEEPVMKVSDHFKKIKSEEEEIQNDLQETTWHSVKPHVINNTIIITVILIIIILAWVIQINYCRKPERLQGNPQQQREMVELETLYSYPEDNTREHRRPSQHLQAEEVQDV